MSGSPACDRERREDAGEGEDLVLVDELGSGTCPAPGRTGRPRRRARAGAPAPPASFASVRMAWTPCIIAVPTDPSGPDNGNTPPRRNGARAGRLGSRSRGRGRAGRGRATPGPLPASAAEPAGDAGTARRRPPAPGPSIGRPGWRRSRTRPKGRGPVRGVRGRPSPGAAPAAGTERSVPVAAADLGWPWCRRRPATGEVGARPRNFGQAEPTARRLTTTEPWRGGRRSWGPRMIIGSGPSRQKRFG